MVNKTEEVGMRGQNKRRLLPIVVDRRWEQAECKHCSGTIYLKRIGFCYTHLSDGTYLCGGCYDQMWAELH